MLLNGWNEKRSLTGGRRTSDLGNRYVINFELPLALALSAFSLPRTGLWRPVGAELSWERSGEHEFR